MSSHGVSERAGSRPRDAQAPVGVLVVDDQAVFRAAAHEVISATPPFEQLGAAASGAEALVALERLDPQLVLLDVRMPGMDGIETARRIAAQRPRAVVVLISVEDPRALPADARTCGAVATVRKQDLGPGLLRRLWSAHGASR